MKVLVIDGQGGGVGRALIEHIKAKLPELPVIALGTNALATSAMIRAGADHGATGENAIAFNCRDADAILGPIGIILANSMLGEVTPAMASAIGSSGALKILIPVGKCRVRVVGAQECSMAAAVSEAGDTLAALLAGRAPNL